MPTRLAKKADTETPVATSDTTHAQLVADPAIPQFTQPLSPITPATTDIVSVSSDPFGTSIASASSTGFTSSSFGSAPTSSSSSMSAPATNLTSASAVNSASDADIVVKNDTESTHWINSKWRPAMGWLYMATCAFDFIIFPILWSILQALSKGSVTSQWQPVTLQGAGLYHIAMGAVLGIAAYGRTKEKVSGTS